MTIDTHKMYEFGNLTQSAGQCFVENRKSPFFSATIYQADGLIAGISIIDYLGDNFQIGLTDST